MSTVTPPPDSDQLGGSPLPYYPYHPPQPPPPSGLGIAALVTGIVGLVLTPTLALYLIGGPIGLVMGPTAMILGWKGRARANRGEAKNDGFALIGAILGLVTVVLGVAFSMLDVWLFSSDWD